MKTTDFYSVEELISAEQGLGMSLSNCIEKRKAILITIYQFREGWIDEDKLEEKLTKIINSK